MDFFGQRALSLCPLATNYRYVALVLFGAVASADSLGAGLLPVNGNLPGGRVLAALVGALLYSSAYLIPVIGDLVIFVLALVGTGASILALLSRPVSIGRPELPRLRR